MLLRLALVAVVAAWAAGVASPVLGIYAAAVAAGHVWLGRHGLGLRDVWGHNPDRATWAAALALGIPALVLSAGLALLNWVALSYVVPEFTLSSLGVEFSPGPLQVLEIGVLAPLAEEVLFRGILFVVIARARGTRTAIVVSSLLFAVLHGDVLGKTVFAATAAVLYVRTSSLLVPVVLHVLNNMACLAVFWLGEPGVATLADIRGSVWLGVVLTAAGGLVAARNFVSGRGGDEGVAFGGTGERRAAAGEAGAAGRGSPA